MSDWGISPLTTRYPSASNFAFISFAFLPLSHFDVDSKAGHLIYNLFAFWIIQLPGVLLLSLRGDFASVFDAEIWRIDLLIEDDLSEDFVSLLICVFVGEFDIVRLDEFFAEDLAGALADNFLRDTDRATFTKLYVLWVFINFSSYARRFRAAVTVAAFVFLKLEVKYF